MRNETERPSSSEQPRDVDVACPTCGQQTTVSVSDHQAELRVRPYVAAFGEYTTAHCPDGHRFWIYYC